MTKSVKPLPELKKKQLSQKQQKLPNFKLGESGEKSAVIFLQKNGYKILDKNIRFRNAELDIVALDTELDEIAFVEVKTRSNDMSGHPSQAVNRGKILAMKKVAHAWIRKHNLAKDYRFDIISVLVNKFKPEEIKVEHFENITFLGVW